VICLGHGSPLWESRTGWQLRRLFCAIGDRDWDDCLGTLRITGVSRALQVPPPDPDPHRCPWERFARKAIAWFESVDAVPVVAVRQNSKIEADRPVI
jgi:hypothetical protein